MTKVNKAETSKEDESLRVVAKVEKHSRAKARSNAANAKPRVPTGLPVRVASRRASAMKPACAETAR